MGNIIESLLKAFQTGRSKKEQSALNYWKERKKKEGRLKNSHFEQFYTTHFNIIPDFYNGKKILDIGCGARGSLEWAKGAAERVGLDPLADEYFKLEGKHHFMKYVKGYSESIPFGNDYFDVVCSLNSFDHVDDLKKSISEIKRVINKGGLFLLLTDMHVFPTLREPQVFSWDVVNKFEPELRIVDEKHFEKALDSRGIYEGVLAGIEFDHSRKDGRYGIILAKFEKL